MTMADQARQKKPMTMADQARQKKPMTMADQARQKPKLQPNDPRNGLSSSQIQEAEDTRGWMKSLDDTHTKVTKHIPTTLAPLLSLKPSTLVAGAKGFTHNMDEYGATINKGLAKGAEAIGWDSAKKSFEQGQKFWNDKRKINELETKDNKYAHLAGEMIFDPLNLTPTGVITKGSKIARVAKSMVVGAGVGAGTTALKNYANDDLSDGQKNDEMAMGAGFVSVLNGIIAGVTKGKVTNAIKDVTHLKGEGKVTADEAISGVLNNPKEFGFTPQEATKLNDSYQKLLRNNSEHKNSMPTETPTSKDLVDDGHSIYSNTGHNLAGGFGAGTVNAGSGLFDGTYANAENPTEAMSDKFIQGMIAGTLGVSGLRMLKKTNPKEFEKVRAFVIDNNIKPGDAMPTSGTKLGVFAGEKAKAFNASKPTHAGKYDGQTRFEIDDSKMEVLGKGVTDLASRGYNTLDKVIGHEELFHNYPQLRNVIIKFDKNMKEHANFDGDSTITISNKFKNKDEMSSSVIHEVQHWIQNKEGFAGGGNFDDMLQQVDGKIYSLEKQGDMSSIDAMNFKSDLDYLKNNRSAEAYKKYQNIAGEIEAREVQARKNLTPEERADIPNYENVDSMNAGSHSDEAYNSAFMAKLEERHGDFESTGIAPKDATLDFSRSKAEMSPVKSKSQKEKRGIYNVTFNGKNSSEVRKADGDALLRYAQGNKNQGAIHIQKHLGDGVVGEVSKEELLNIGNVIRNGDVFESYGKNVYELNKDGIRYRAVTGSGKNGDEKIITFYSNRNLKEKKGYEISLITNNSSSNKTIIPQNPKNPNMRDGFLKLPKSTSNIFDNSFDDLERLANKKNQKDWGDISSDNSPYANIKNSMKDLFTDTFSAKYHASRDLTHTNLNQAHENIAKVAKVLDTLDDDMNKALYQYMTKTGDGKALPKNVKALGDMISKEINDMGASLVTKGQLDEKGFKEWQDAYLYRQYDTGISKGGMSAFKQNFRLDKTGERGIAKEFAQSDLKGMRGWLNEHGFLDDADLLNITSVKQMQDLMQSSGKTGLLRDGAVSITTTAKGKIKLRRDFTKTEREAMGEIESAKMAIPETLARLHRLKQHSEFLSRAEGVEGVVLDSNLAKELSRSEIKGAGFSKVDDNPMFGALSGKWVRNDVHDDIGRLSMDTHQLHSDSKRAWNTYHGLWKKSKTVWNPTAHFNNFVGNAFLMHMAGVNASKFKGIYQAGARGLKALKEVENLEFKQLSAGLTQAETARLTSLKNTAKYAIEAKQNGVFGKSQLNDILAGMEQKQSSNGMLSKLDEMAGNAYQMEDNFNRLSFYQTLRHAGKDAKMAKDMVDYMLPDYSKPLPKGWRFMRDTSIAPFISWSYYTMPSIVKMMKTKTGAVKVATVIASLSAMEYALTGGEITPMDNIPFMNGKKPEDYKGRRFAIGKDGDKIHTLKMDRMIPYAELQNIPNFVTGQVSGITPNILYALNGLQMYNGRPITSKNKDTSDKIIDWLKHLTKQNVPLPMPIMNMLDLADSKLRSKKSRKRNGTIQPRNAVQELLKNVGLNTMTYSKSGVKKEQTRE